jgi:hypothetical protein
MYIMTNKYTIIPAEVGRANSTGLVGYMIATYDEIVEVFGEPTYNTPSADEKVDVEWVLKIIDHEFDDEEHIATIYNWKDYDGGAEARSGNKYEWHIGGHRKIVVGMLIDVFQSRLGKMPT